MIEKLSRENDIHVTLVLSFGRVGGKIEFNKNVGLT